MLLVRKMLSTPAFGVPVFFFLALCVAEAQTATASSAGPLPRGWFKAASLRPGELLSVQLRFARAPTLCSLAWIDNTALACDAATFAGPSERLVFPAAQVYSVARHTARDPAEGCEDGKRMLAGALIGSAVGGLILSSSSGRAGAVGAMLGAGVGAGIAAGPQGFGTPVRPAMAVRFPLRRPGFPRVR